jgi:hypothetical protein
VEKDEPSFAFLQPSMTGAVLMRPPAAAVAAVPVEAEDPRPPVEPRMRGAWRAWLASLAVDAEAAVAAAHLYAELPGEVRDAWLDALAEDVPMLEVPGVAVYGPLLAVEADPERRLRMSQAAGVSLAPMTEVRRALLGAMEGGVRIAAIVMPLYLDFVRLLVCRFVRDRGFELVCQDPILRDDQAPVSGSTLLGVKLFASSVEAVIDELAHAVLAHRRSGRELPELLRGCSDLFSAKLDVVTCAAPSGSG